MNPAFVLLILLPAAALGMNCTGQPDGNYEIGCRSYSICTGGKTTIITCDMEMAYNQDTGKCDDVTNIPPPCGIKKDCSNAKDGRYADVDNNCKSYYTCVGGEFAGHNFCPSSLVFNEKLQSCDWPKQTPPPCGTSTGTSP
ncbi:chitin-binding domain protein cbd-1 [Aplysia californica]|uniref:Chitin-binding domain protein cbd-1 n=1 Tax=Aplysia californica TaxID=6500 RepID=A0ABM0JKX5_APLCA|nr:chitin-binding domain protein cbd-1 [Aplysia californica]